MTRAGWLRESLTVRNVPTAQDLPGLHGAATSALGAAQILPPGQAASGFFYFNTEPQSSASIYINGLMEAKSGKELFYFDVPLQ